MKWMMSILAAAVMTTWTGIAAQSGSSMSQDRKMDGRAKMGGMDATYTGCIEAAGAGKFTLAHTVAATSHMAADSMKESPMKKNELAMDTMKKDSMMSTMLTLSSTAVDLGKHVGQKVSVTGSGTEDGRDGQGRDGEGAYGLHREVAKDRLGILLVRGRWI